MSTGAKTFVLKFCAPESDKESVEASVDASVKDCEGIQPTALDIRLESAVMSTGAKTFIVWESGPTALNIRQKAAEMRTGAQTFAIFEARQNL